MFNILGLFFDLIGVVLLFFYGPPSRHTHGNYVVFNAVEDNERIERANRQVAIWSRVGMSCLVLGFSLQLAGSIQAYRHSNNYSNDGNEDRNAEKRAVVDPATVVEPSCVEEPPTPAKK